MKLITLGDSITKGTYTADTESSPNTIANPTFSQRLKELLGYDELINYAMNGIAVSRTTTVFPEHAMSLRYQLMEDADTVIIAAGTNDFGTQIPLGTADDKEDISFYGALDVMYRGLKEKYPSSRIYIITPIHRHDEDANKLGLPLSAYRHAIEERAATYGFPVIDGFGVPIDAKNEEHRRRYIKDGVHPNTEGHRLYAEYVYEKIKEFEERN